MTQKPPPPDPLVGLLDEMVDHQAVTIGVLDEGLQALVRAFEGTERIAGRDGRDGRNGRDGESVVEFRSGYDRLSAPTRDGLAYFVGHAVHGTPQDETGWWIERWPQTAPPDMLVVELAEGVQEGQLRWSDRESYTYLRSEAATRARRRTLARFAVEQPEEFLAELADAGIPPDSIDRLRDYISTYPDTFAAYFEMGGDMDKAIARLVDQQFPKLTREGRVAAIAYVQQILAQRPAA